MKEIYFTVFSPENNHDKILTKISNFIYNESNIYLKYYRKLKTSHSPLHREVKVVGKQDKIEKFKSFWDNEVNEPRRNLLKDRKNCLSN